MPPELAEDEQDGADESLNFSRRPFVNETFDRRSFLRRGAVGAAAGALGVLCPARVRRALAIEPIGRKTPPRLKLGCAAYSLRKYLDLSSPRMTLEEFVTKCAEWQADGVELTEYYFPKPVTPAYVMKLKRHAALCGLDVTGTPIGNNFALPAGVERDRQVASVKSWIDVSADLGSPAIRIFAGNAPKGIEEPQARKWVVECIEACCDTASKRGVFLAVENHGGVVATAEGVLEIVKSVSCPWVGVNLDTGNFHTPDPYGDIERCAPYAVTCQVKTEVFPSGGKKEEADLERLVAILRKSGYSGYVTLEYEASEEPMEAVPKYLKSLRKLVA
jgi:sugar phosphate isomerase/epimerase